MPSKESPCKTVQVDSWTLIAAVSFGHGSLRTPSGLRCLYGPPSKSALRNAATELISTASRLSRVWLFLTPWTVARQAPLSMEFSRQEYWSGLSFPPLGYLPDPEIEPGSPEAPALTREFFTPEPPGKPPFPQLLWLNETLLSKGLFFLKVYLFGCTESWLQHAGSFRSALWAVSCGIWGLVPWSGTTLRLSALGAQSLRYWTTRKVHQKVLKQRYSWLFFISIGTKEWEMFWRIGEPFWHICCHTSWDSASQ